MSLPVLEYRKGTRGYKLHLGSLRVPQSSYMLAAAIVVGTLGGYGAIGFRSLIGAEQHLSFGVLASVLSRISPGFALVLILALGGAIAAGITARFAPEARGHGVPEVMAAVALRGGIIRPRVIGIKAIASATSIAFGGSVGREGAADLMADSAVGLLPVISADTAAHRDRDAARRVERLPRHDGTLADLSASHRRGALMPN